MKQILALVENSQCDASKRILCAFTHTCVLNTEAKIVIYHHHHHHYEASTFPLQVIDAIPIVYKNILEI